MQMQQVKMTPEQFNVFVKKQVEFGILPKRLYAEKESFVNQLCEEKEAFINRIFAESYKEAKLYPYSEADYSVMALEIAPDLTLIRVDFPESGIVPPLCYRVYFTYDPITGKAGYYTIEKMAEAGMRRSSCMFAVGGGMVGDIAGLAAALYMRGISLVQIPTTLLAQIDSSVGGKTAVNLGGIKNTVGAFYQPCTVLVDPMFLETLPPREIKCGLGEMVKYAALSGEIFDELSKDIYTLGKLSYLKGFIADCIRYKAKVVEADEKEENLRRCLNIGHTTGHAIEVVSGFSHGESVLYGMYLETKLALEKGVCEREYGDKLCNLICGALAVEPRSTLFYKVLDEGLEKARMDKKNGEDGQVQMAVAKARGEWTMLSLPFEEYAEEINKVIR
jgi:3-dehydroquinate synthase